MPGALSDFLQADHARLDEILTRAAAQSAIDLGSFDQFREGLLRHIAMEEKVLLPDARRRRGGPPLDIAKRLKADHAAIAALLVPTPTPELIAKLRDVLAAHNPLEEGPGGLYELCEGLAGEESAALLSRIRAIPKVPVAPYFDGPRAFTNIELLLRARTSADVT